MEDKDDVKPPLTKKPKQLQKTYEDVSEYDTDIEEFKHDHGINDHYSE
jgi:hypothetical protein